MIVKNESKIIGRLLETVFPIIDSYCICDTGSTDNTIEVIGEFFNNKEKERRQDNKNNKSNNNKSNNKNNKSNKQTVNGKIICEPFRDFGYNRSFALKACHDIPNADYVLLVDADMKIEFHPDFNVELFKKKLTQADAFHLTQGSASFIYDNIRIVRNSPEYSYWGVTHEYVKTPPNAVTQIIDKKYIFINDIGDGGCKDDKFERDVRLLTQGLVDLPDNDRYTFYLANSYMALKKYDKAIENYKKRIALNGWGEEVWYSYYSIGNCYSAMEDWNNALFYWLEAYSFSQDRIENLYHIVKYYRVKGQNRLAYDFWEIANDINVKKTKFNNLFLEKSIYDYKLKYEFTIISYYYNRLKHDVVKPSMEILSFMYTEEEIRRSVLMNYKFYAPRLDKFECFMNNNNFGENKLLLENIGKSAVSTTVNRPEVGGKSVRDTTVNQMSFTSSTPTICLNNSGLYDGIPKNQMVVNVRYVNYTIDGEGKYINRDKIVSKNIMAVVDISDIYNWTIVKEFELKYDVDYEGSRYEGVEDIRLFYEMALMYNANRDTSVGITVENGFIDLGTETTCLSRFMTSPNGRETEKNWVLCKTQNKQIRVIYEWYPLTIGTISNNNKKDNNKDKNNKKDKNNAEELLVLEKHDTPELFKWVRGSTNGVNIGDEIWFICHLVSYEDRRYYYHLFVVLDDKTLKLKRYSKMFTFEGCKVEYTLGFIYFSDLKQLMIGYSTNDNTTKYTMISMENVLSLF